MSIRLQFSSLLHYRFLIYPRQIWSHVVPKVLISEDFCSQKLEVWCKSQMHTNYLFHTKFTPLVFSFTTCDAGERKSPRFQPANCTAQRTLLSIHAIMTLLPSNWTLSAATSHNRKIIKMLLLITAFAKTYFF